MSADTVFRPIPAGQASTQSWRSLLLLSGYRWLIAVFLAASHFSGRGDNFFGKDLQAGLFEIACIAYLLLCIPTTLLVLLRRPRLTFQLYFYAVVDVLALTLLVFAAGGVNTGLGMLLITPIAGTSILLPRRQGVLIGAMATLALLGEEVWRYLQFGTQTANFIQAGMLGLVYLFTAWVANALSARAAASEVLAERRKVALDNLAQINERIIAHIQVGVLVIDTEGRIRLLNQAACQLLNIRPSASGRRLDTEFPALSSSLDAWRRRPLAESEPVTTEAADHVLLAHFSRLSLAPDAPTLIFLEDAGRISEQAQQMKLAALGRLTASIAHEIRNPLGAISHASQLLSENLSSQPQDQRLLEIIHRHTGRINTIVEEMLGLSRRDHTVLQTLRLHDWLGQVAHEYCESRRDSAPRIDYEMVSPAVEIRADAGQLIQVLHNLWDNAISHAGLPPEQLVIQLSADLWPESGRAYLDVYDNGHGISPAHAADIFEPFYTTTRRGTGLGLYIARELCECNHAKLSLIHGSTLGACFRIVFANPKEWLEQDSLMTRATIEQTET
jgi:two-component system sensor histidine kinase PilS (NtrC family)